MEKYKSNYVRSYDNYLQLTGVTLYDITILNLITSYLSNRESFIKTNNDIHHRLNGMICLTAIKSSIKKLTNGGLLKNKRTRNFNQEFKRWENQRVITLSDKCISILKGEEETKPKTQPEVNTKTLTNLKENKVLPPQPKKKVEPAPSKPIEGEDDDFNIIDVREACIYLFNEELGDTFYEYLQNGKKKEYIPLVQMIKIIKDNRHTIRSISGNKISSTSMPKYINKLQGKYQKLLTI